MAAASAALATSFLDQHGSPRRGCSRLDCSSCDDAPSTTTATSDVGPAAAAEANYPPSYFSNADVEAAFEQAGLSLKLGWLLGDRGSAGQTQTRKAFDVTTGEMFVVKSSFLDKEGGGEAVCQDADVVCGFMEELQILRSIKHPSLIGILGHAQTDKHLHILREYSPCGSLADFLRSFGALEGSILVKVLYGITEGLSALHLCSPPLPHGNLKGSQVLVDAGMNVKLTGFDSVGRACQQDVATSLALLPWLAPERVQGLTVGNRRLMLKADIWSLGCVFMEAATAESPWGSAATCDFVRAALLQHQPMGIASAPPMPHTLPEAGRSFALCCFKRTPSKRPRAASLLLHPFVSHASRRSHGHAADAEGK